MGRKILLTFNDIIDNISMAMEEADGEYIAEVHNRISSTKVKYVEDSVWEVI